MRILLVSHTNAGWTPYFARFFMSRGDEVLVASFSPQHIDGIQIEYLGPKKRDWRKNKYIYFTRALRLRRIIRRFEPDIVYAIYLSSNGLTAALAGAGILVVSAVGSDVLDRMNRRGLKKIFREGIIKFVSRRTIIINTVSEELDQELIRLGVDPAKIIQMPFGVNLEMFYPAPDMPRSQATRFICTRGHKSIYDIPTIIDALALLKKKGYRFQCILTSDGPLLKKNRKKSESLGLQDDVTFTGFVQHNKLPQYLRKADIYISASLGDGTSVSLLEAMATGLAPVVSKIKANLPWIQHGKTGMLFEAGKAGELAEAIEKTMNNMVLRKKAFDENRVVVQKRCDMYRNMEKLARIFQRLIKQKEIL